MIILPKPEEINQLLGNIPEDLKSLPQWVVHRDKIPHNPQQPGQRASPTDPATWGTFKQAVQACKTDHTITGAGFVFTKDDPYCGIDLDKCRDPQTGIIEPWAQKIVDAFDSYTEVSPFGTGIHAFIKGTIPGLRNRKKHIELYECNRYFCMTGNHVESTRKPLSFGNFAYKSFIKKLLGTRNLHLQMGMGINHNHCLLMTR